MYSQRIIRTAAALFAALTMLISNSVAFAAPAPASPNPFAGVTIPTPNLPNISNFLSCKIEATIKATSLTSNTVTYKISYNSVSDRPAARYGIQAASETGLLYNKSGIAVIVHGTGYMNHLGGTSHSFSFPIAGVSKVTMQANIDGVKCAGSTLNIIRLPLPSSVVMPNPSLQLDPNINLNGAGAINIPQQPAPAPAPAVEVAENHSCRILAQGIMRDDGVMVIGAAYSFEGAVAGREYSYAISGFSRSNQNAVQDYGGKYTVAASSGTFLNPISGRGFIFQFRPANTDDRFIISAMLGNLECAGVVFGQPQPAPVVAPAPAPVQPGVAPDANNSGGAQPAANSGDSGAGIMPGQGANGSAVPSGGQANADQSATVSAQETSTVVPLGMTNEDAVKASALNLIDAETAKNTNPADSQNSSNSDSSAYLIYALLGGVAVAVGVAAYRSSRGAQQL